MISGSSSQSQFIITAHDTLQQLSYTKRPAFNVLWEPKDTVSIDIKAIDKRRILGDKDLETVIKTRPRSYMTPSVSIDDIQDIDKRNLIIAFMYKRIANQIAKEVWKDFEIQRPCLLDRQQKEEQKKLLTDEEISCLPARFQGTAKKWDTVQNRSFLINNKCYNMKDKSQKTKKIQADTDTDVEKKLVIRKLINENELSIIYDKLPSSYKGHRSYIAKGVSLKRK